MRKPQTQPCPSRVSGSVGVSGTGLQHFSFRAFGVLVFRKFGFQPSRVLKAFVFEFEGVEGFRVFGFGCGSFRLGVSGCNLNVSGGSPGERGCAVTPTC